MGAHNFILFERYIRKINPFHFIKFIWRGGQKLKYKKWQKLIPNKMELECFGEIKSMLPIVSKYRKEIWNWQLFHPLLKHFRQCSYTQIIKVVFLNKYVFVDIFIWINNISAIWAIVIKKYSIFGRSSKGFAHAKWKIMFGCA